MYFLNEENVDIVEGAGGEKVTQAFGAIHINRRDLELDLKEHFRRVVRRKGRVGGVQRGG